MINIMLSINVRHRSTCRKE